MSEPFLGQIIMFAGNFPPRGWAFCDGQLLPINQYSALFSILGTMYGGDGRVTFGLPDLRGRFAVHPGSGPGLPTITQGQRAGAASHTLTTSQLPSHNHTMNLASSDEGELTSPEGNILAISDDRNYVSGTGTSMGASANVGGGQSVNNMPPFLGVRFIIALVGLFPPRN